MARLAKLSVLLLLAPLAACASVQEAVNGPSLTPMGYPAALMPQTQPVLLSTREPAPQPASAGSLWKMGARAFFADQRAGRVGDILTVLIEIDDSASTSNSTTTNRTSGVTAGVPAFFGLESSLGRFLPGGFDPANLVETTGSSSSAGTGAVTRSERISLTMAAIVTQVLPNGNMVIQGNQQVRTNGELRELTVSGLVRPEDITAANTIRNDQIAEARISYGGRGDVSRVQRTPAGQALIEQFSPF